MDEFYGGFCLGLLSALTICSIIVIVVLGGEEKGCEKDYNVYKCKRIYIPAVDETLTPIVNVKER